MARILFVLGVAVLGLVAGATAYHFVGRDVAPTFADVALNRPLPAAFEQRNVLAAGEVWARDFEELVGQILRESDEGFQVTRPVAGRARPLIRPISDGLRYSGKIDGKFELNGGVGVVTAGMEAGQVAELSVADTVLVSIPVAEVPWDELASLGSDARQRLFYVRAVLLTSVTARYFKELESTAGAIQGEAFGAKGRVYTATSSTANRHILTLDLIDVAEVGERLTLGTPAPWEGIVEEARVQGVRIDQLRPAELEGAEPDRR